MPTSAPRSLLRSLASLLALATPLAAQSATLLVGNPGDPVDLRVVHWNGSVTDTLDAVLLHPIDGNGRSDDLLGGLDGHGHVTIGGWPWLELADSTRLAIFERTTTTGHGLVLVPPDGAARIVYEASHQLDVRMAIAADGRHLAFARGTQLTFVRLTGSPYADGAWHRTVLLSDDALGQSLVIGPSHAFFVTDDDHVYRCSLADAGLPEAVTPNPGASVAQGDRMALSGDGRVAAFLRGQATDEFAVWVVGTTGPARMLALPESNYLQPDLLPSGTGEPHLLLSHDGSRVMVTELQTERELHHVETGLAGGPQHLTGDAMFAEYIGGHILPKWSGSRLLFASGHDGWRDWYVRQPDGTVDNLTQTGSPEPPFLVGSLDVRARLSLGNGSTLATEAVGALERLRHLDPAGSTQVLFSDLVQPPSVGAALTGAADSRIVGLGGTRLLSGHDGTVRLALPPGLDLLDPIRSPNGITALYAHLGGLVGVLALQLPDGTLLLGSLGLGVPQMSWTAAEELLLLWPDHLQVLTIGGATTLPMPAEPQQALVSGACR